MSDLTEQIESLEGMVTKGAINKWVTAINDLEDRNAHLEAALKRLGDPHLISDVPAEEQNQARINYANEVLK